MKNWDPENQDFWSKVGRKIAYRNLTISTISLFLSFAVWMLWSAVAVNLNNIGFSFTTEELFTLAALPGLSGATLRIVYSFVVPIFGGRNWTVFSTLLLLIPALGIGLAVQNKETPFETMALLAMLCGLGGGNFSSSMSNISFFFPKHLKGTALGINAGFGNLGIGGVQFLTPEIIGFGLFGALGGEAQAVVSNGIIKNVWLQNAAFIWVLPIILTALASAFGMNNLDVARSTLSEQFVIFKRKHMWIITWLYTASFGSFIGFSAAFPLLIKTQFEHSGYLHLAFLGPTLGALARPVGGWLADRYGGAVVSFWDMTLMAVATLGAVYYISLSYFWGFFVMFIVLFITSGIANGSVFRIVPAIFEPKEAAPVLGFSAAIAAYGGFFVPEAFSFSIKTTGGLTLSLVMFVGVYLISLICIWYWYMRKNAECRC